MTQERIDILAKEFTEPFEPQFKKVAADAYKQGLKKVDELIGLLRDYKEAREKFDQLCKGASGGMAQFWREDAGFEMTRREDAIKAFIKAMEE